jgi:hypothetical protein
MARPPLRSRRIHIAGSISPDAELATTAEVQVARDLIGRLVQRLIQQGATFVVPVDAEKLRECDGHPICFDWLIWKAIHDNLHRRPGDAPLPLAIAVQHHKNEEQIPAEFQNLWDRLRESDLVQIENVSHWNMNSKRMEAQARWGDVLLTIGGGEGVLFLANLYHDVGKPVVPLNLKVGEPDSGSARLFTLGLSSSQASRLFHTTSLGAHGWMNRINFTARIPTEERAEAVLRLLEALEPPKAFVVRMLNPDLANFEEVEAFFATVVQPIVEGELGYEMQVVDGRQAYEHPRIDQEIFARLHRSSVVFADMTGMRPNCFLELGYAFGRGLPTMLMAQKGASPPFDIHTFAALHWSTTGSIEDQRRAFREHWAAIRGRPPLVPSEPLIS